MDSQACKPCTASASENARIITNLPSRVRVSAHAAYLLLAVSERYVATGDYTLLIIFADLFTATSYQISFGQPEQGGPRLAFGRDRESVELYSGAYGITAMIARVIADRCVPILQIRTSPY